MYSSLLNRSNWKFAWNNLLFLKEQLIFFLTSSVCYLCLIVCVNTVGSLDSFNTSVFSLILNSFNVSCWRHFLCNIVPILWIEEVPLGKFNSRLCDDEWQLLSLMLVKCWLHCNTRNHNVLSRNICITLLVFVEVVAKSKTQKCSCYFFMAVCLLNVPS